MTKGKAGMRTYAALLVKERQNYRTKLTQVTNQLFDIREGQNDDLVWRWPWRAGGENGASGVFWW